MLSATANIPLDHCSRNTMLHCVLTDLLVFIGSLHLFEAGNAAQQGTAPAGHNPLLHGCPGGVEGVCNAVLLLIHLYVACSTDLNIEEYVYCPVY